MKSQLTRRQFHVRSVVTSIVTSIASATSTWPLANQTYGNERSGAEDDRLPQFGLVTYLWGKNLTLAELLGTCEEAKVLGVELRTTHRHGVEPALSPAARSEVKQRFADSPVTLVGLGSDERFDDPDQQVVKRAIEKAKEFVKLSHDVGSSGVKVKGDRFHRSVPRDVTLTQVVNALRQVGDFAADYGQQIRLEVHGGFAEPQVHHEIMQAVNHPHVRTCWNSNRQDLEGGLEANFRLLSPFFGDTAHLRTLDSEAYPTQKLIRLFVDSGFYGWLLLEAHGELEADQVEGKLTHQQQLFQRMLQAAKNA